MKHTRQLGIAPLILSIISILLTAGPSRAVTYIVTSLADNGGAGELRGAISAANGSPGSTITFKSGLSGTITLSPSLQALPTITVATTIVGPGESLIAVDGRGTYRPFHINAAGLTVTMSGLTIQHGMDAGGTGGAGILVEAGNLVLTDCTLAHNVATGAGGAICNFGTATLTDCKLTNNSAHDGGGIYNYTYSGPLGTAALVDCILSGNGATINGGGVENYSYSGTGGQSSLKHCRLVGNSAGTNGGGLYNYGYSGSGGTAVLENCALSNNSSAYGGGFYNYTYSGSGGTATLKDCSLSGNSGSHFGGIYSSAGTGSGGNAALVGCILYGDIGGEIFGAAATTFSDIQGGHVGNGNINVNPLFINPASGNLTLDYTSPCIGAGTAITGISTDLPGQLRHNPTAMGAYEGGSGMGGHNILALQNSGTRQVALWTVAGDILTSQGIVSRAPPTGWNLVGVADFNGDGTDDLLFQDQTTNRLAVWYLNDFVVTGTVTLPSIPATGWDVVGVTDVKAEGKPEIVFQNPTNNTVFVWFMNGTQIASRGYASQLPSSGWKVVGSGDFKGDGNTDILFQNGPNLIVWYMNGLLMTGSDEFWTPALGGLNVVAVASLYGHVNPDLVLQNPSSTSADVWELNDFTVLQDTTLSAPVTSPWAILAPK